MSKMLKTSFLGTATSGGSEAGGVPEYIVGNSYTEGQIVINNGSMFEALQNTNQEPSQFPLNIITGKPSTEAYDLSKVAEISEWYYEHLFYYKDAYYIFTNGFIVYKSRDFKTWVTLTFDDIKAEGFSYVPTVFMLNDVLYLVV